jgi:hypothetical protein
MMTFKTMHFQTARLISQTNAISQNNFLAKNVLRPSLTVRAPLFGSGIDGLDTPIRFDSPLQGMSLEQIEETIDFFVLPNNMRTQDLLDQMRLKGQLTGLGPFRRAEFQLKGAAPISGQAFLELFPKTYGTTPRDAYRLLQKTSSYYSEQEEVGLEQTALVMQMMERLGLLEVSNRNDDPFSMKYNLSRLSKKILESEDEALVDFDSPVPARVESTRHNQSGFSRSSAFLPLPIGASNGLSDDEIMNFLREESAPARKPDNPKPETQELATSRTGKKTKGKKGRKYPETERPEQRRIEKETPRDYEFQDSGFDDIPFNIHQDEDPELNLKPEAQDTRTPEEKAFQDGVDAIHHLENELLGGLDQEVFSFGDMAQTRTEQLRSLMNVYEPPNNGWEILNTVHQLNKKSTWQKLPFTSKGQTLDMILKQGALGMSSASIRKHLAELEKLRLIHNTGNASAWRSTPGLSNGKLKPTDRFVVTEKGLQALQQDNPKVAGVLTTEQLQQLIRYEAQQIKQKQATDEQEWKALKFDLDQSQAHLAKRQSLVKNMEDLLQAKLKRDSSFEETPECKTIQVRLETLSTHLKQEEASHQHLRERSDKALILFDEARVANQKKLQALMQASYNLKQKTFNQEVIDFTSDLNRSPASSENALAGPTDVSPYESQDQAIKVLEAMIQSDLTHSEVKLDFTQA